MKRIDFQIVFRNAAKPIDSSSTESDDFKSARSNDGSDCKITGENSSFTASNCSSIFRNGHQLNNKSSDLLCDVASTSNRPVPSRAPILRTEHQLNNKSLDLPDNVASKSNTSDSWSRFKRPDAPLFEIFNRNSQKTTRNESVGEPASHQLSNLRNINTSDYINSLLRKFDHLHNL